MNSQYVKFFRESIIALGITVFGELITGSLWGSFYAKFILIAGIIALIPVISENRGNISGIFTSRLGTGLHLGSIKPSLTKRTKELNNTILMNIVLTLSLPVWTSLVVFTFFTVGGGSTTFFQFFLIAFGTAFILVFVQPILTVLISFIVYRKGLDPDVVVYPVTSVIADVLTTIALYISVSIEVSFFPTSNTDIIEKVVELTVLTYFLILLVIVFSRKFRNRVKITFEFLDLLKESLPIIMISIMIGATVGIILNNQITDASILLILPIYMSFTGAVGSIIGSKFTTSYYLGSLSTNRGKIEMYISSPLILIIVGMFLSTALGIVAFNISSYLNFSLANSVTIVNYVLSCILIGIVTTSMAIVLALTLGNVSFKWNLDADNVIIPLSTTLGDLIAILSVIGITSILF